MDELESTAAGVFLLNDHFDVISRGDDVCNRSSVKSSRKRKWDCGSMATRVWSEMRQDFEVNMSDIFDRLCQTTIDLIEDAVHTETKKWRASGSLQNIVALVVSSESHVVDHSVIFSLIAEKLRSDEELDLITLTSDSIASIGNLMKSLDFEAELCLQRSTASKSTPNSKKKTKATSSKTKMPSQFHFSEDDEAKLDDMDLLLDDDDGEGIALPLQKVNGTEPTHFTFRKFNAARPGIPLVIVVAVDALSTQKFALTGLHPLEQCVRLCQEYQTQRPIFLCVTSFFCLSSDGPLPPFLPNLWAEIPLYSFRLPAMQSLLQDAVSALWIKSEHLFRLGWQATSLLLDNFHVSNLSVSALFRAFDGAVGTATLQCEPSLVSGLASTNERSDAAFAALACNDSVRELPSFRRWVEFDGMHGGLLGVKSLEQSSVTSQVMAETIRCIREWQQLLRDLFSILEQTQAQRMGGDGHGKVPRLSVSSFLLGALSPIHAVIFCDKLEFHSREREKEKKETRDNTYYTDIPVNFPFNHPRYAGESTRLRLGISEERRQLFVWLSHVWKAENPFALAVLNSYFQSFQREMESANPHGVGEDNDAFIMYLTHSILCPPLNQAQTLVTMASESMEDDIICYQSYSPTRFPLRLRCFLSSPGVELLWNDACEKQLFATGQVRRAMAASISDSSSLLDCKCCLHNSATAEDVTLLFSVIKGAPQYLHVFHALRSFTMLVEPLGETTDFIHQRFALALQTLQYAGWIRVSPRKKDFLEKLVWM